MSRGKIFYSNLILAVLLSVLILTSPGITQEPSKELTPEQIQASLAELMKTLPEDKESSFESSESTLESYDQTTKPAEPEESTANGVIARLESSIAELSDRKLDRAEGQRLLQLKLELKIAKTIASQLSRTKLVREKKSRAKKNAKDSFVITKIEVAENSAVADVTFAMMVGELENTDSLFNYLKSTPSGSFRDYRIVSRHADSSGASSSLESTRQEYDLYKEREKQMLAYIAARNKQLAAVKRSRRC